MVSNTKADIRGLPSNAGRYALRRLSSPTGRNSLISPGAGGLGSTLGRCGLDAEDPAGARSRRWAVEAAVAVPALLLLAFAAFAGPAWLQRHFLPEFFHPRSEQLRNLTVVRGVAAAL